MIFAICVVICVTLLIYYFIYKKWSDAVKIVGKSILKIVKPLYKFLFKVFPISVVLISIATLVLAVALMVTAIQRSVENKDNTENAESVEDVKYDDISFVEKFFDRAENRAVNFLDGLARMGNSFNKFIGIEEGKDNETPEFGIEYILIVAYAMSLLILWPFILILVLILTTVVLVLELLVGTLIMDIVMLIIRLKRSGDCKKKIQYWWEWAKE